MLYSFTIATINDLFIILIDDDKGCSLTSDAHNVIRDLQAKLPNSIGGRKVYYKDTDGRFHRLVVKNGVFAGFAPCSPGQQKTFEAIVADKTKQRE
ncbi:MAG: hypothetical protein GY705_22310 [Bacteroidetes bacterium]|nr:hypothetical protein [Bacteroidota bacterium]